LFEEKGEPLIKGGSIKIASHPPFCA